MFIKCMFGIHDYRSELRTYDVFSTRYTDIKKTQHWAVHFLKCKSCGKRKFETNYNNPGLHSGIDQAKAHWLEEGYISDGIKYHTKPKSEKRPNDSKSTKDGLTGETSVDNILMKALSTQSESEAIACLRKARKRYAATN